MNSFAYRLSSVLSLFLAVVLSARAAADYATPYHFGTLAGTSSIGSQDGAGAAARFYSPRAVAVDAAGNAFIVDQGNHTIRKITPAGAVTTFAGSPGIAGSADGTGAAARFDDPRDIVADPAGNLYVTDSGNHTIRKLTPAGVVTTLAGLAGVTGSQDGAGTLARFNAPRGLAIDASGNLYVTDAGNHAIRKIAANGTVSTLASAQFPEIWGAINLSYGAIAVDSAGAVYVSRHVGGDTVSHLPVWGDNYTILAGSVTRYASDGTATDLWPTAWTRYFDGRETNTHVSSLAFDATGQLVAASGYTLVRYAATPFALTPIAGDGLIGGSDGAALAAKFGIPLDLALDGNGNLLIADTGNNTVRKLAGSGMVSTVAGITLESAVGSADGTGAAARFTHPFGMAVDAAGNVYVADHVQHVIRKITPAGVVSTFAGAPGVAGTEDGTGTAARFTRPVGITIDGSGVLFVTDSGNHTVRRITPAGETSTFAGTAAATGGDDGQGPEARFFNPTGIALDQGGNVYVASAGTVRKITPAGLVTTLAGLFDNFGYEDATGSAARFEAISALAVRADGNLYATEASASPAIARIRKISPAGVVTTIAGGDQGSADGSGTAARFHDPVGLAADGTGNLFVADSFNQTIRKVTSAGAVSTVAGLADSPGSTDGTGQEARFFYPQGVAVDGAGALYVTSGTTVRKGVLATLPVISTQPANANAQAGSSVSFSVTAGGTPAPTYQWQRNGAALAGATGSTLSLANVQTTDAGDYTVVVANALGSVTSNKATLAVTAAPAPPPPAPSGGGGGGAPSAWFVGSLVGLWFARFLSRRSSA